MSATQVRAIVDIKPSQREVYLTRITPHSGMFAFSHRWEQRENCETFTVLCDNEKPYKASLKPEEAENILGFLPEYNELWLDYVCIDQDDHDDKVAQIALMGQNYGNCTTLVVGTALRPEMPPTDYLERAWCFQERHFGFVRFPWNFETCDPEYLKRFARDITAELPGIGSVLADKTEDALLPTETWRLDAMPSLLQNHPDIASDLEAAREAMITSQNNPSYCLELSKICLRMREKIDLFADVDIDPWHWQIKMFECKALHEKDRLYGVWCVPMYKKGYSLPYDDVPRAWAMIKEAYPQTDFAFSSPLQNPRLFYSGKAILASVEDLILSGMNESSAVEGNVIKTRVFSVTNGLVKCTWFAVEGIRFLAFAHESVNDYLLIMEETIFRDEYLHNRVDGTLCQPFERFLKRVVKNNNLDPHWSDQFVLVKDILVEEYRVPRERLR